MTHHKKEQEFFRRINNPNTFRRDLLMTSKMSLSILKQATNITQLREAKQDLVVQIGNEVKELKVLVKKMDELLPTYSKDEIKKRFPHITLKRKKPRIPTPTLEKKQVIATEPVPLESAGPADEEIDKLSKALADVQKKLQTI